MKLQVFIVKNILRAITIAIVLFVSSCINFNTKSNEDGSNEAIDKNAPKTVKEVILEDNGAVVPTPQSHRVVLKLKNSESILLSYVEQNGESQDGTQNDIEIDGNTIESMRDEIDKIIESAEDGIDVKVGKQPCVGMNSLNVSVVYNTGDTSRFAVTGSARCDPSLYPSVWAVDSMATEMYRAYKSKL